MHISVDTATELLGVRADACPSEVQSAYRRKVKELRPDLGQITADEYEQIQAARRLLLVVAGRDRRHTKRSKDATYKRGMRRTSWQHPDPTSGPSSYSTVL